MKPYRLARDARASILALLCLSMLGCGSAPPAPTDRYYALEPRIQPRTGGPPLAATLLVNDLAARGFLGGRQILYRTREQPLVVERYAFLLWDEPASRALSDVLAETMRQAGLFAQVIVPASGAGADFRLGGTLTRFEHRPTDQPPRVEAGMSLTLVRARDRRAIWTRDYEGTEPVTAQTPDAMAEAFNRLAARLAEAMRRDLEEQRPSLEAALRPETAT